MTLSFAEGRLGCDSQKWRNWLKVNVQVASQLQVLVAELVRYLLRIT